MECYDSKRKLIGILALMPFMVAAAYYCTTLPALKAQIAGWAALIVLFGGGLIVLPNRLLRTGPQIVISDEGIDDRRLRIGVVPWEDVAAIYPRKTRSAKCLCVELRDPDKYLSRMSLWKRMVAPINRAIGFGDLPIDFSAITPGIDEVIEFLKTKAILPDE